MKLTVLGCYGSFPGVDGACSGYLLQDEGMNILLDCGNGTISRLQRYINIEDIDAVILTHFHFDHTADAFTLKYALETKMAQGQQIAKKKLLCPAGPAELAGELFDGSVFDVEHIREDMEVRIGTIRFSFFKMRHLIESYAVVAQCGGKKLVYTGDTADCDNLLTAADHADLLLCESTILGADTERCSHHLSAAQGGRAAANGRVGRLLLTHFWYETERQRYIEEAKKYFGCVSAAEEYFSYEV